MSCDERIEQLSALLDGELAAAELAELTAHLALCTDCARRLAEFCVLRAALAHAVPEEEISADFLARVEAALDAEGAAATAPASASILPFKRRRSDLRAFVLGAGAAAIAATLLFTMLKPAKNVIDLAGVRDAALRGNVALNTHPMPAGAPLVPGFKLASARSDVVAGHAAEVLAYTAPQGSITLCIWKANGEPAHPPRQGSYRGMNILYWNDGEQEYWAAAKLPMADIEAFWQLMMAQQS